MEISPQRPNLRAIQELQALVTVLGDQLRRRAVEKLAIALRGQDEARRNLSDSVHHLLRRLERLRLALAGRRQITHIRRPLGIGMAQRDDRDGLRVWKHPLKLESAEEDHLVGDGALLHDAGNSGEIEIAPRERHGALKEPLLIDREGKGAVKGNDEGPLRLELPEVEEEERFDARVLVESAIPHVPIHFFVTNLDRARADERRKRG